jgi:hypothetical protein
LTRRGGGSIMGSVKPKRDALPKGPETVPRREELFADVWLIYESEDDPGMWVAHSLKTDQVAVGDCVLQAYVIMKRVMRAYWIAIAEDPSLEVERAPKAVWDMLKTAKPLENALMDRADELLSRRPVPDPSGKVFKALDLEIRGEALSRG